ncbi:MAG: hypothetical protein U9P73_09025 [Candidatus Cloacimonadota bacterium]|nr:hypothetical protein [Candidatus Cloacimonadota bacterium]
MLFKFGNIIIGVLVALLLSSCSHKLEIKNLRSYQNLSLNPLEQKVTIGIIPSIEDISSKKLMKGIATALMKYSATVVMPYTPGSLRKPDVLANISIRPEYKGSGWNFLINWPGFLIWTPAWHGYVYKVNYDVSVLLTKASDNTKIDSFTIPVKLDVRHAEMDRTWTEISWLEWSVIAFVGGIVFTQYDSNVSPLVAEKIETPIGDYIAQDIIDRLNSYGQLGYIYDRDSRVRIALLPGK